MKKTSLILCVPMMVVLSGCATEGYFEPWGDTWDDYDFHNQVVNSSNGSGHYSHEHRRNYKQPRQYNVTQEDENKYHALNDRIHKRQMQLRNQTKPKAADATHEEISNQPTNAVENH